MDDFDHDTRDGLPPEPADLSGTSEKGRNDEAESLPRGYEDQRRALKVWGEAQAATLASTPATANDGAPLGRDGEPDPGKTSPQNGEPDPGKTTPTPAPERDDDKKLPTPSQLEDIAKDVDPKLVLESRGNVVEAAEKIAKVKPTYGYGAGQLVCTTFCQKVLENAGYEVDNATANHVNVRLGTTDCARLGQLVDADDPRIKGVVTGLVSSAQGLEIPLDPKTPASRLAPGDFIQYWRQNNTGHAVMVHAVTNATTITMLSSHSGTNGVADLPIDLTSKDLKRVYAVRPMGSPAFLDLVALRADMGLDNGPFGVGSKHAPQPTPNADPKPTPTPNADPKPAPTPTKRHVDAAKELESGHAALLDPTSALSDEEKANKTAWDADIAAFRGSLKGGAEEHAAERRAPLDDLDAQSGEQQASTSAKAEAELRAEHVDKLDEKRFVFARKKKKAKAEARLEHLGLLGADAAPVTLTPADRAWILDKVDRLANTLYFSAGLEDLDGTALDAMTVDLGQRVLSGRLAQRFLGDLAAYWSHFSRDKLSRKDRRALKGEDPEAFDDYRQDRQLTRQTNAKHTKLAELGRDVAGLFGKQHDPGASPDDVEALVAAGASGAPALEPHILAQPARSPAELGPPAIGTPVAVRVDQVQSRGALDAALAPPLARLGLGGLPAADAPAPASDNERAPHEQVDAKSIEGADEAPPETQPSAFLTVVYKRLAELVLGVHQRPATDSPRIKDVRPGDRLPVTPERQQVGARTWAQALVDAPPQAASAAPRLGWVDTAFTNEARSSGEPSASEASQGLLGEVPRGLSVIRYLRPVTPGQAIPTYPGVYPSDTARPVDTVGAVPLELIAQTADNDPDYLEVLVKGRPLYVERARVREAERAELLLQLPALSVAEIQEVRAYATRVKDPAEREAVFTRLQGQPAFVKASDASSPDAKAHGPLASLGMALESLGLPIPYTSAKSYADALEMVRLERGLPPAHSGLAVAQLVSPFGASAARVELAQLTSEMGKGKAVLVVTDGKTLRLAGKAGEDWLVDDPSAGRVTLAASALGKAELWALSVPAAYDEQSAERADAGLRDKAAVTAAYKEKVYAQTDTAQQAWYLGAAKDEHGAEVTASLQKWLPDGAEAAAMPPAAQRKAFDAWLAAAPKTPAGLGDVKARFVTPLASADGDVTAFDAELKARARDLVRPLLSKAPSVAAYDGAIATIDALGRYQLLDAGELATLRTQALALQPKPETKGPTDEDFTDLRHTGGGEDKPMTTEEQNAEVTLHVLGALEAGGAPGKVGMWDKSVFSFGLCMWTYSNNNTKVVLDAYIRRWRDNHPGASLPRHVAFMQTLNDKQPEVMAAIPNDWLDDLRKKPAIQLKRDAMLFEKVGCRDKAEFEGHFKAAEGDREFLDAQREVAFKADGSVGKGLRAAKEAGLDTIAGVAMAAHAENGGPGWAQIWRNAGINGLKSELQGMKRDTEVDARLDAMVADAYKKVVERRLGHFDPTANVLATKKWMRGEGPLNPKQVDMVAGLLGADGAVKARFAEQITIGAWATLMYGIAYNFGAGASHHEYKTYLTLAASDPMLEGDATGHVTVEGVLNLDVRKIRGGAGGTGTKSKEQPKKERDAVDIKKYLALSNDASRKARLDSVYATDVGRRNLDVALAGIPEALRAAASKSLLANYQALLSLDIATKQPSWTDRAVALLYAASRVDDQDAARRIADALDVAEQVAAKYPELGREEPKRNDEPKKDDPTPDPSGGGGGAKLADAKGYNQGLWYGLDGKQLSKGDEQKIEAAVVAASGNAKIIESTSGPPGNLSLAYESFARLLPEERKKVATWEGTDKQLKYGNQTINVTAALINMPSCKFFPGGTACWRSARATLRDYGLDLAYDLGDENNKTFAKANTRESGDKIWGYVRARVSKINRDEMETTYKFLEETLAKQPVLVGINMIDLGFRNGDGVTDHFLVAIEMDAKGIGFVDPANGKKGRFIKTDYQVEVEQADKTYKTETVKMWVAENYAKEGAQAQLTQVLPSKVIDPELLRKTTGQASTTNRSPADQSTNKPTTTPTNQSTNEPATTPMNQANPSQQRTTTPTNQTNPSQQRGNALVDQSKPAPNGKDAETAKFIRERYRDGLLVTLSIPKGGNSNCDHIPKSAVNFASDNQSVGLVGGKLALGKEMTFESHGDISKQVNAVSQAVGSVLANNPDPNGGLFSPVADYTTKKVRLLALYAHGASAQYGKNWYGSLHGHGKAEHVKVTHDDVPKLVGAMKDSLTNDVRVRMFACSTANGGAENSFAGKTQKALASEGKSDAMLIGHRTADPVDDNADNMSFIGKDGAVTTWTWQKAFDDNFVQEYVRSIRASQNSVAAIKQQMAFFFCREAWLQDLSSEQNLYSSIRAAWSARFKAFDDLKRQYICRNILRA